MSKFGSNLPRNKYCVKCKKKFTAAEFAKHYAECKGLSEKEKAKVVEKAQEVNETKATKKTKESDSKEK
jgi:hypothetical protein